uniref:Eukaryotic translation initiation factor 4C n=1 Tax=Anthurium amnicola TaxID=1678845 RepID=A0A1D1YXN4_9ARAE
MISAVHLGAISRFIDGRADQRVFPVRRRGLNASTRGGGGPFPNKTQNSLCPPDLSPFGGSSRRRRRRPSAAAEARKGWAPGLALRPARMPKNKGKGGKNRKRGKNEADDEKRELVFKEDGQEYAQVLRMLGNGRCEATCIDGTKRLCHIRGKMHKKVWIAAGDIVLVGLRDYQDDKADVILKYMPDEARLLKAYGELPDNIRLNEGIAVEDDDEEGGAGGANVVFEEEDIDRI